MVRVSKLGSSTIIDVYVLVSMPGRGRKRWTFALAFRGWPSICLHTAGKCVAARNFVDWRRDSYCTVIELCSSATKDRDGSVPSCSSILFIRDIFHKGGA